jgi:bis(5'-nucleosidyl)-tetraphosphatase
MSDNQVTPKSERRKDRSLGIIPLRKNRGQTEIFLVKHHNPWWGLPKGHAEADESDLQAAERELLEETGLRITEWGEYPPIREFYTFYHAGIAIDKEVVYFLAWVEGEVELQAEEIADGAWLTLAEAYERITFPEGKDLITKVQGYLESSTS